MNKLKHKLSAPLSKFKYFDIDNMDIMIDILIFNGLSVNNTLIFIHLSLNNIINEEC